MTDEEKKIIIDIWLEKDFFHSDVNEALDISLVHYPQYPIEIHHEVFHEYLDDYQDGI